ncbi:MAG TPA: RNA methyltransferase [Bacteroidales bacterium]|nr:RNA methyltransferase [Bacteroidales bacterium]HRU56357.1 RNA methyltransferase [Bacteroidales bacterium]
MLSKNKQKFIISLQKKKAREETGMFVIEGDKMVKEFMAAGAEIVMLIAKPEYIAGLGKKQMIKDYEVIPVTFDELRKVSTMKSPHNALAVVKMPDKEFHADTILDDLSVALDTIQDPGNLGTIIRAAAWFGIKNIVCSENSVDVYNPKVVQATMGALLNVNVFYRNLDELLDYARKKGADVFGTYLDGCPIYEHPLGKKGIILLGNESKGISENLTPYVTARLTIPAFKTLQYGVESLNAGMAASIVFYEFRRRKQEQSD